VEQFIQHSRADTAECYRWCKLSDEHFNMLYFCVIVWRKFELLWQFNIITCFVFNSYN